MKVTGGCSCEDIQYEAEIDENAVFICHCENCQRHSGSAYRVVVGMIYESFELTSGELSSFEKVADSGTVRARTFCPTCGTNIYSKAIGEGMSFVGLRYGTIDQRDQLIPKAQFWCRSAQPWAVLDSLPKFETSPTSE